MRAYFELNDKGTCNRFTLIKGIQKTHTFIHDGGGGSKLHFDGTEEQFELLMRDIYGVISPTLRTKAIFIYVELPDVDALEKRIADLESELAEARKTDKRALPFPAAMPSTLETDESIPAEETSQQPDVGLPVGPGDPPPTEVPAPAPVPRPTRRGGKAKVATKAKTPVKRKRKQPALT